ncbi:MAG: GldG family protein [Armatimonadota bacterium]
MPEDEEREEQEEPEGEEPEEEEEAEEDLAAEGEEPEEDEEEEEGKPKRRKRRRRRRADRPRRVMREELPEEAPPLKVAARFAVLVGLVLVVLGLIWWSVSGSFTWPARILVIVGGGAVIASVYLLHEEIIGGITRRTAFAATNTAVALLAILGILVLANYVALRYVNAKWDSTEGKRFSLSESSKQLVKKLDRKVELVGFYDLGSNYGSMQAAQAEELFGQYDELSAKLVTYIYDVRKDADKATDYGVTSANQAVAKAGDRRKEIYTIDEQQVTNAIAEVTVDEKPKVYFLSGHGERGLESDQTMRSYSKAKSDLEDQQYEVASLSLLAEAEDDQIKVPDDCKCLVIMGARSKLHEKEVTAIRNYLADAGRAYIALGPPPDSPDMSEILGDYGVTPLSGYLLDTRCAWTLQGPAPSIPAPTAKVDHLVSRPASNFDVFMELPRPLEVEEQMPEQMYPNQPPPPQDAQILFQTSPESWRQEGTQARTGDEPKGPFGVLVAVDKRPETAPPPMPGMPQPDEAENTRLIVAGTASLADDNWIDNYGNRTLFLSCIAWLAQRVAFIAVPPKTASTRTFAPNAGQAKLIKIITIIVLPALVAITGVVVWWRRR